MAGYSGTLLPQKLGIKDGHRVALVEAPPDFEQQLGRLPDTVTLVPNAGGREPFNVIVLFVTSAAQLRRRFTGLARRLVPDGGLWVAWPKKASGVETDLTESVVRTIGLETGLVDNKVCAVDEVWSGLRFVIRLKDRPPKKNIRAGGRV
jgi:hypothetical protein